jgi:two-component system sensor histidine kinase PilS (NtrC family)
VKTAQLPVDQRQTLKVFSSYRILLATLLLLVFLFQYSGALESAYKPGLFLLISCLYLVGNVLVHFWARGQQFRLDNRTLFVLYFAADIFSLTLISHANGGLSGGVNILLTLTVATASIFYRGQLALFVAAVASIAVVANATFLLQLGVVSSNELLSAGLLGAIFFASSLLIQTLVRRIESSQTLAAQKSRELADSQYLNELIVRRMQTGIVVADANRIIQTINDSALQMLGQAQAGSPPRQLPQQLVSRLQQWQEMPHIRSTPFQARAQSAHIQAEFMRLAGEEGDNTLIFLEDTSRARQHAQQIKLASLGRLTASIAHEIRNPLSAINHAAQLLDESEELSKADQRLSQIITNHAARMNQIIENIQQLSRREAAQAERIELETWLPRFVQTLKEQNPGAIIEITNHASARIAFDPSQLDQVLTNLCTNGLRYSQRKTGEERLDFFFNTDSSTGLPYLDIIDHGDGVAADQIEKLFEPFYTSESQGTGLGLFIAKELCEANQARLDYLRTQAGLSCFRITFAHPQRKLSQQSSES